MSRKAKKPSTPEDGQDVARQDADESPSSGWSRHRAPEPHPTRSGEVACLGCDRKFFSWDRTRNRLCPKCAARANRDTGIDR